MFPNASFIGMYRDPVDVVGSYLNSGIYDSVESASLRWLNSNKILMAFKRAHPKRCLIVRYEELVRNYDLKFKEVCSFCALDYRVEAAGQELGDVGARAHHSNVLKPVSAASIGKGKMELNEQQIELVQRITASFDSRSLI